VQIYLAVKIFGFINSTLVFIFACIETAADIVSGVLFEAAFSLAQLMTLLVDLISLLAIPPIGERQEVFTVTMTRQNRNNSSFVQAYFLKVAQI